MSVPDGRQFRARISGWAERTGVDLLALARQSVQELGQRVRRDTPVDTGTLRSWWSADFGSAPPQPTNNPYPVVTPIELAIAELRLGQTIRYTNGAAYAMRIEFGFVGPDKLGRVYNQKGRFFVTRNVRSFGRIVEQTARELGAKS